MIRELPMHASRWDFMESNLQTIESFSSTRLLMVYMLFVAHSQTPISCLLSTETCCCHQSHQKGASIQFCKNFKAIMLDDMTIMGYFSLLRAWIILWNVYFLAAFAVWVDIAKTGCNWFLWSSNLAASQELPDREDGMPVEAPNPNSWKVQKVHSGFNYHRYPSKSRLMKCRASRGNPIPPQGAQMWCTLSSFLSEELDEKHWYPCVQQFCDKDLNFNSYKKAWW